MRFNGKAGIAAVVSLVAAACASAPTEQRPASVSVSPPPRVSTPAPPMRPLPAAETLAQGLKMVPVARDARGCVQYRMQSATRPSLAKMFYRTNGGDFSTIEEEAACT